MPILIRVQLYFNLNALHKYKYIISSSPTEALFWGPEELNVSFLDRGDLTLN